MELTHVERQRTELLRFVLLLMILVLGLIAYLSLQKEENFLVVALTVVCLGACLYVLGRERRLKELQRQLIEELIGKEREVADEQQKTASLEGRLREITSLYRAISTVNANPDPERTFETALRAALELVSADCGSIMLLDDNGEDLFIVASHGLSERVVGQTRRRIGEGVAGWVAEHQEPVLLNGRLETDERFVGIVEREEELLYSISLPLSLRNRLLGVLNLGVSPDSGKTLSEHDLRIVNVFAQHASVAIENAGLVKNLIGTWQAVKR